MRWMVLNEATTTTTTLTRHTNMQMWYCGWWTLLSPVVYNVPLKINCSQGQENVPLAGWPINSARIERIVSHVIGDLSLPVFHPTKTDSSLWRSLLSRRNSQVIGRIEKFSGKLFENWQIVYVNCFVYYYLLPSGSRRRRRINVLLSATEMLPRINL